MLTFHLRFKRIIPMTKGKTDLADYAFQRTIQTFLHDNEELFKKFDWNENRKTAAAASNEEINFTAFRIVQTYFSLKRVAVSEYLIYIVEMATTVLINSSHVM